MNDDLRAELVAWLDRFSECVREKDLAGAEQMFERNVLAFGTRNELLPDLEALRDQQWQPTWSATRDFRFLPETIHVDIGDGGTCAWASCLWSSEGVPEDGPPFERRGRATFIFVRDRTWRCVHSHLSMSPTGSL